MQRWPILIVLGAGALLLIYFLLDTSLGPSFAGFVDGRLEALTAENDLLRAQLGKSRGGGPFSYLPPMVVKTGEACGRSSLHDWLPHARGVEPNVSDSYLLWGSRRLAVGGVFRGGGGYAAHSPTSSFHW
jgi:hypothetical protein